jgi:hypothetical protein
MYTPEELTVMRTGLDLVTIIGKNAKALAQLQDKVEKDITKINHQKGKRIRKNY